MRTKVINIILAEDGSVKTKLPKKMTDEVAIKVLKEAIRDIKAKECSDDRVLDKDTDDLER